MCPLHLLIWMEMFYKSIFLQNSKICHKIWRFDEKQNGCICNISVRKMPFLPSRLDTQSCSCIWNSRYFFLRSLPRFWFLLDIPSWLWCLPLILLCCLSALKKVQGIYCYYGEACVSGLHFPEKNQSKVEAAVLVCVSNFFVFRVNTLL